MKSISAYPNLKSSYWTLNYGDRRSIMGRLTHYGWSGLAICPVSPFELKGIQTFMDGLPPSNGRLFKPVSFKFDSHDDIVVREICAWVRQETDFETLLSLIEAMPVRSEVIFIKKPFDASTRKQLEGRNWCLYGSKKDILSCESFPELEGIIESHL